jgi:PAS domain S-box-containing protein
MSSDDRTQQLEAEVIRLRACVAELEGWETEYQETLAELRSVHEHCEDLYRRTPALLHSIDPEGRLLDVSDEWLGAMGYAREEVIGRKVTDFLTKESARLASTVAIPALLREGSVRNVAYQFVKKNGEVMDVLLSAIVERGPDGGVRRSMAVVTDITPRKRVEEELRQAREQTEERIQERTTALSETVRMLEEQIAERHRAEAMLEEQRAFLRQVIDVDPNFIFAKDRDGRFTLVNQAVAEAYGTTVEDLIGKTDADFNSNEEEVRYFREMDLQVMNSLQETFIPEEMITDSTGSVRWLQTVKRPLEEENGRAHQVLGSATDITARREAEERLRRSEAALRQSQRQLQTLAGRLLTAQEEERRRLAREMHDDLSQRLAALAIAAGKLEHELQSMGTNVPGKLRDMKEQAVQLSSDVHAISRQLHPSILEDLGLADALESECSSFAERQGITVDFRAAGVSANLRGQVALSLYRIAQEALHNIAKHSGAPGAEVHLKQESGFLLLSVRDVGRGFDAAAVRERHGLGLASMEERARLLGADFEVESSPGEGTHVKVRAPLE